MDEYDIPYSEKMEDPVLYSLANGNSKDISSLAVAAGHRMGMVSEQLRYKSTETGKPLFAERVAEAAEELEAKGLISSDGKYYTITPEGLKKISKGPSDEHPSGNIKFSVPPAEAEYEQKRSVSTAPAEKGRTTVPETKSDYLRELDSIDFDKSPIPKWQLVLMGVGIVAIVAVIQIFIYVLN